MNDGDVLSWLDDVRVAWVNYVQGWNTKKSDGTGREILKEAPTWIFKPNGDVLVSNTITALEDIDIYMYYGLQMQANWMDKGVFLPSASREIISMSRFTPVAQGGLGTRFAGMQAIGYDTDVNITMGYNPDVDLGDGSEINDASIRGTRIHTSTIKFYVYMIFNNSYTENGQMMYNGYYQFRKP